MGDVNGCHEGDEKGCREGEGDESGCNECEGDENSYGVSSWYIQPRCYVTCKRM